jgi:hypothetical protein
MGFGSTEVQDRSFAALIQLSLVPFLLLLGVPAYAADHFVSSSTTTVNCGTFGGGVKPGDTITLAAGNRGPLAIRNCTGTTSNPITIRNDAQGSSPTVIRRTSAGTGGFILDCLDCVNVVIDGTNKWSGAPQGAYCGAPAGTDGCGIKVTTVATGDAPSAFLKLRGMSTRVTVRGIAVDGRRSDLNIANGIGIDLNDHNILAADHPGFWREAFVFERNYVRNTYGEGMYIGPNWRAPDLRIPLRDITIRENLVEDTGRESIQLKSAIGGTNRIHHNVARRSGQRNEGPKQGAGISVVEGGSNMKIYNNRVEGAGVQGIQHYNGNIPESRGPFLTEIFNNVVNDSGRLGGADSNGHGITVANKDGSAGLIPTVYNNTVVAAAGNGINFGSRVTGGVARNNILVDTVSSALSVGSNKNSSNLTGKSSSVKFLNATALDFQLSADSPARDAGTDEIFPNEDFMGIRRPQGQRVDQGAYEFLTATLPRSPEPVSVE